MTSTPPTPLSDVRAEAVRNAKDRLLAFATQVDTAPPPEGSTFWRMGLVTAGSILAGGALSRLLPRIGRSRAPSKQSPRRDQHKRGNMALGAVLLRAAQLFAPMIIGAMGRALKQTPGLRSRQT